MARSRGIEIPPIPEGFSLVTPNIIPPIPEGFSLVTPNIIPPIPKGYDFIEPLSLFKKEEKIANGKPIQQTFDVDRFKAIIQQVESDAISIPISTTDIRSKGKFKDINFSRFKVKNILNKHSDKLFVKRILDPSITEPLIENGLNVTHLMSYSDNIVFPTVVLKDGKLVDLEKEGIDPYRYAIINNNYIEMGNEKEAEALSMDYKKVWKKPTLGDQVEEALFEMAIRSDEVSKKGVKFYKKSLKELSEENFYIHEPLEAALSPSLSDDLSVRLKKEILLLPYIGIVQIPREAIRDPKGLAKGIAHYYAEVLWNWSMVLNPMSPNQLGVKTARDNIARSPIFNILPLLPIGIKGMKTLKGKSRAEINKIATKEAQKVVDYAKKNPEAAKEVKTELKLDPEIEVNRQQLGEPIDKVSKERAEKALAIAESERQATVPKKDLVESGRQETIPSESKSSGEMGREKTLRKDHKNFTETKEALENPKGTVYENMPPARINEQIELINKKIEEVENESKEFDIELKEVTVNVEGFAEEVTVKAPPKSPVEIKPEVTPALSKDEIRIIKQLVMPIEKGEELITGKDVLKYDWIDKASLAGEFEVLWNLIKRTKVDNLKDKQAKFLLDVYLAERKTGNKQGEVGVLFDIAKEEGIINQIEAKAVSDLITKGKKPPKRLLGEAVKFDNLDTYLEDLKKRYSKPVKAPSKSPVEVKPARVRREELFPEIKIDLKKQSKDIMLANVRKRKSQVAIAFNNSKKWKEELTDQQLKDVGAAVEKIGNIDIKGDTYEKVKGRFNSKQKRILEEYKKAQEQSRKDVNIYLKEIHPDDYISYIKDYLAHFYVGNKPKIESASNRFINNSPNAKRRKLPTLQDAIDVGLTPVTQNIADLYTAWSSLNWRVATNRKLAHDLKNLITEDGDPVLMPSDKAPPEWVRIKNPILKQLYARKNDKGQTIFFEGEVAVHPDVAPAVKVVFGNLYSNKYIRGIEVFNAWSKRSQLSFSLFHHGALTESSQAVSARLYNPLRGLFVIREVDPILGKRIAITQPHRIGKRLARDNVFLEDAISHGLQIGATSDAQLSIINRHLSAFEAKTRGLPLLSHVAKKTRQFNMWWDKTLWDNYHSGLKAYSYYDITHEMMKKYPNVPTKQIKETIAEYINDAFGGQEWEAKLWATPNAQKLLHSVILAPDWTLSNINIFGKTFTPKTLRDPIKRRIQARYWRNMIPTLWASHTAIQFAIYQLYGDDEKGDKPFMWDNEFGKEDEPDVTPLIRALPYHDENDDQRYYIHFGKQKRETMGWIKDPLKTIFGKSSPVVHVAMEQIFELESISGFPTEFKEIEGLNWWRLPDAQIKEIALRGKSLGGKFIPFAFRENNFAFTAPMSKGMTNWKATKAMEQALDLYANPSFLSKIFKGYPAFQQNLTDEERLIKTENLLSDIIDASERNGLNTKQILQLSLTNTRRKYYKLFFEAIEDNNEKRSTQYADAILRLHAGIENVLKSAQSRGIDFDDEQFKLFNQQYLKLKNRIIGTP